MYYAVSGLANAETLHIFNTKEQRNVWVTDKQNDLNPHYTMCYPKVVTKKQAIEFFGSLKAFNQALENANYKK